MSKILRFVEAAKENSEDEAKEINFGIIPNFQAQQIAASTGVVVRTALRTLTSYAVNHTFKRHGVENENK